ncbi:MAG: SurA N-terminal domain-containing protein [Lachnospiraceae bacterium]|nr:SurA N-terminal domain-containing protein [Lachnospiraceae bacterium]
MVVRKKTSIILLLLMLIFVLITGCGGELSKENQDKDSTVVFQYGDNIVTKAEVYIYVNTIKERYESQYGQDVWELSLPENSGDEVSMADLTREAVVTEIVKIKTLCAHADDYDVSLTEKELADIDDAAKKFFDGLTENDKASMDMTLEKVTQVMTENTIAKKVEDKILENSPIEISDEQARETTFYDMYFECYSIDEKGVIVPFDNEKKRQQYEQALSACSTIATTSVDVGIDSESMEKLSEYYKLEHAGEKTMTPEEILETYGEDIYNLLYNMKNGDYSTVVESEYGYHVFLMISLTDIDATAAKKEQMTLDAIDNQLSDTIDKWKKEIDADFTYPDSVDMDVYDTISIAT